MDRSTTDKSVNPSVKQNLTVEVNGSDNPKQVRREVENVSGQTAIKGLSGALKRENGG